MTAIDLVNETFGPQFSVIATREAETISRIGDLHRPLVHLRMAIEFYEIAIEVLERTPVKEVEAVLTILDCCINWQNLSRAYLETALKSVPESRSE